MSKPNEQHTVPKSYLSQWADKEGKFWIKDFSTNQINQKTPNTALKEYRIYNLKELPDPYQLETEIIGVIENKALPIIKKIQKEFITENEQNFLAEFLALQRLRTPKQKKLVEQIEISMSKNSLNKLLSNTEKFNSIVTTSNTEEKENYNKILEIYKKEGIDGLFSKFNLRVTNARQMWLQHLLQLLHPIMRDYLTYD